MIKNYFKTTRQTSQGGSTLTLAAENIENENSNYLSD
jgi:hypothetical protein